MIEINTFYNENCLDTMKTHEGLLGGSGILTNGTKYNPHQKVGWNGIQSDAPIEVDLVGHAWFFKQEWIRHFWSEPPVSWDNGEDIQLSYLSQKYGNINTYVPPHSENDKSVWGTKGEQGVKYGSDENANWLTVSNHTPIRNELCVKFLKDGWKL